MSNPHETQPRKPLEALAHDEANVGVTYVAHRLGHGGRLELSGKGAPALRELVHSVRDNGLYVLAAFSRSFVTERFEQGIEDRIRSLHINIGLVPDDGYRSFNVEAEWTHEANALRALLSELRKGEIVVLPIGKNKTAERRRGLKRPSKKATYIEIWKPAVFSTA